MSDIITIDSTERRIEDRDLMTGNQGNIITQADVGLLRHQEGMLEVHRQDTGTCLRIKLKEGRLLHPGVQERPHHPGDQERPQVLLEDQKR